MTRPIHRTHRASHGRIPSSSGRRAPSISPEASPSASVSVPAAPAAVRWASGRIHTACFVEMRGEPPDARHVYRVGLFDGLTTTPLRGDFPTPREAIEYATAIEEGRIHLASDEDERSCEVCGRPLPSVGAHAHGVTDSARPGGPFQSPVPSSVVSASLLSGALSGAEDAPPSPPGPAGQ